MTDQSHGQLMNAVYRNQRFIYDITRKYYLLGRDQLIEDLNPPEGGSILEIACGTGRNLIKAGRRYPTARLYGLDISTEMLVTARANLARAGMADRAVLVPADACDFDAAALFGIDTFDRVFLSYSLSMIPDWQGALNEAARHVAPGGQLSVVDFSLQRKLPGWFAKGLHAWLAKFHVAPRPALPEALTRLGQEMGAQVTVLHPFRDYAISGKVSLRG